MQISILFLVFFCCRGSKDVLTVLRDHLKKFFFWTVRMDETIVVRKFNYPWINSLPLTLLFLTSSYIARAASSANQCLFPILRRWDLCSEVSAERRTKRRKDGKWMNSEEEKWTAEKHGYSSVTIMIVLFLAQKDHAIARGPSFEK